MIIIYIGVYVGDVWKNDDPYCPCPLGPRNQQRALGFIKCARAMRVARAVPIEGSTQKLYKCDYPLKASRKPAQRMWPILATLIPKNKSSRFVHCLFQTTILRRLAGSCYLQLPTLNSMQQKVLHTTYCCAALARSGDVLIHVGCIPSHIGNRCTPD